MNFEDKQASHLIAFIRRKPRATQTCRDHMSLEFKLSSAETEEMLAELRDEHAIAFANGEWYFVKGSRVARVRGPKKAHARQTDFFDSEAGHLYEGPSKQVLKLTEQWRAEKRCSR